MRHWSKNKPEFWDNVDKSGECWVWTGRRDKDGYGKFSVKGKQIQAHRYAFEEATRANLAGLLLGPALAAATLVCHHCDNPPCVRPAHLFEGTHADNHADRNKKNRQARGERGGRAKLTAEQVAEIRKLYVPGDFSQAKVARKFGVSQHLVSMITRGVIWKH